MKVLEKRVDQLERLYAESGAGEIDVRKLTDEQLERAISLCGQLRSGALTIETMTDADLQFLADLPRKTA